MIHLTSRHVATVVIFVALATLASTCHQVNAFSLSANNGNTSKKSNSNQHSNLRLPVSKVPIPIEATVIHTESPTILTIDNLLSSDDISHAMELIMERCIDVDDEAAATTSDYQEDIFRAGAEQEEDEHFASSVDRSIASGNTDIAGRQDIPDQYEHSPLECFLWVITNHPNAVSQEDIVLGANYIKRREARQKWESEGGQQLLDMSMDDEPFERAGRRYEMPREIRDMLVEKVVKRILIGADVEIFMGEGAEPQQTAAVDQEAGIRWAVQDATVVVYNEGESQVPHVDPCDATILVYFDEQSLDGGDTCFPWIDCRVPVDVGKVVMFFSSTPLQKERDATSLHHGGLVKCGRKVVAQLMLKEDRRGGWKGNESSWFDVIST